MNKLRDVVRKAQENDMAESSRKEKQILPHEYGCQIILEKTSLEKAKDSSFPNDAYLIWYIEDGKQHIDLTRCHKRVQLFDMYYDKYGPGAVQKIDFGYGRVNPRLWGYKQPEKKKRK
jgi:hypothetical protein